MALSPRKDKMYVINRCNIENQVYIVKAEGEKHVTGQIHDVAWEMALLHIHRDSVEVAAAPSTS